MASRRLSIYLNDHFAASVAAEELAARSARSNHDTPLGAELERLAREIGEDRQALEEVMRDLGVSPDQMKAAGAWMAEKLGRLKLNGSWVSYSPLSRLEELEILTLGVEGKLLLWEALVQHRALAKRAEPDLDQLIRRARSQRRRLNRHRLEAVQNGL